MKNPVVHFEMPAEDRQRMSDFYSKAFGWETKTLGEEMGNYVMATTTETDGNGMIKTPGHINGGFYQRTEPAQYPSVVISVDNLQDAIKNIKAAGGTVHGEPMDIPGVGTFVSFSDTEGNRSSALQPQIK